MRSASIVPLRPRKRGDGIRVLADEPRAREDHGVIRRDRVALVLEQHEVERGDAAVGRERADEIDLAVRDGLIHQ